MSVDRLQEKIRKGKNVLMVDLTLDPADLPPAIRDQDWGGARKLLCFGKEILAGLKGIVPAVRLRMSPFALMGPEGLEVLRELLKFAAAQGYYVALDVPMLASAEDASFAARALWGPEGIYPCDGAVVSAYPGSDVLKPFLPFYMEAKKDLFVLVRTSNRSASELQDLLTGSRVVHGAAADLAARLGEDCMGRSGFSRVGILSSACSPESLRSLRGKYPKMFLLADGLDYPWGNGRGASYAFDRLGHGGAVCVGSSVTCAWKQDGEDDYVRAARDAAQRINKNMQRYITVL